MTDDLPRQQRIAAYCVVVSPTDELLLVQLNERTTVSGSWTLPGGGIDFGEDPAAAALRELEEETGYVGELEALLGIQSVRRQIVIDGRVHDAHGIRVVYRATIVGGELRHEPPGNSSERAQWHALESVGALPTVDLVTHALRLAGLAPQ